MRLTTYGVRVSKGDIPKISRVPSKGTTFVESYLKEREKIKKELKAADRLGEGKRVTVQLDFINGKFVKRENYTVR